MGETVVKITPEGRVFTEDGRPVTNSDRKPAKLPRPVVHALGRIEQILACADRLMCRVEPDQK